MKQHYIYMLNQKSTDVPIQDVFLSRSDARESKRMYEMRDGTKYSIVRYKSDKKVR